MPFLGISVVRSNGEYILAPVETEHGDEPKAVHKLHRRLLSVTLSNLLSLSLRLVVM